MFLHSLIPSIVPLSHSSNQRVRWRRRKVRRKCGGHIVLAGETRYSRHSHSISNSLAGALFLESYITFIAAPVRSSSFRLLFQSPQPQQQGAPTQIVNTLIFVSHHHDARHYAHINFGRSLARHLIASPQLPTFSQISHLKYAGRYNAFQYVPHANQGLSRLPR